MDISKLNFVAVSRFFDAASPPTGLVPTCWAEFAIPHLCCFLFLFDAAGPLAGGRWQVGC